MPTLPAALAMLILHFPYLFFKGCFSRCRCCSPAPSSRRAKTHSDLRAAHHGPGPGAALHDAFGAYSLGYQGLGSAFLERAMAVPALSRGPDQKAQEAYLLGAPEAQAVMRLEWTAELRRRPVITSLRHTQAGGQPDSFERFSPWGWIPAFAGMTESYCLPDPESLGLC